MPFSMLSRALTFLAFDFHYAFAELVGWARLERDGEEMSALQPQSRACLAVGHALDCSAQLELDVA